MDETYLATSSMVAGIGLSFVSESNHMKSCSSVPILCLVGPAEKYRTTWILSFFVVSFCHQILHLEGWMWWGRRWWPWIQRWGWGWWGWSQPGPPLSLTRCLPPEMRDNFESSSRSYYPKKYNQIHLGDQRGGADSSSPEMQIVRINKCTLCRTRVGSQNHLFL